MEKKVREKLETIFFEGMNEALECINAEDACIKCVVDEKQNKVTFEFPLIEMDDGEFTFAPY